MNKSMLRAVMIKNGDTQQTLAKFLGMALSTLNAKLNSKTEFTQTEIAAIKNRYNLTGEELSKIFFN